MDETTTTTEAVEADDHTVIGFRLNTIMWFLLIFVAFHGVSLAVKSYQINQLQDRVYHLEKALVESGTLTYDDSVPEEDRV